MSEQNDAPPPTESKDSGGDEAVEQEEQAPEPTEPVEGGEETAETQEVAETDDGESADEETAPELTEPEEADEPEEPEGAEEEETAETLSTEESASETSEDAEDTDASEDEAAQSEDEEMQSEGGEQQPLSPDLERHVFEGEVKDNGRLVGYHHREGGEDQGDAKIVEGTKGAPDEDGVYEAKWTTDDSSREKYSTFFPDSYSQDDVRGAVREAWDNQTPTGVDGQWRGVTSDGITVEGYVKPGKSVADSTEDDITTAYPLLKPPR